MARSLCLASHTVVSKNRSVPCKVKPGHLLEVSCRLFDRSCRLMEGLSRLMDSLRAWFLIYSTAMDVFYTGLIVRCTVMRCFGTSIRFRYKAKDEFVLSNNEC